MALSDRFPVRFDFEGAEHFVSGPVEEWARFVEGGESEVLQLGEALLIDVLRL